jgi:hypothetical protein
MLLGHFACKRDDLTAAPLLCKVLFSTKSSDLSNSFATSRPVTSAKWRAGASKLANVNTLTFDREQFPRRDSTNS